MHIKYILIKKFKSYRDLSYMEPLNEGVNLVIGSNGHGKSNFLDAIIFVLTDKYSNLRQEDKKLLIHEEPGEETNQISVELIIENKSRRFPVDKDTVNITKIYHVNENREEILINQKKLLKSDVYNLLESAGFCKQNPYYIIQQGKINTIINMNEFELFEQFSEVTGTKIYEEKKIESMKLLEESRENRSKILKQSEEINEYILRLESQCEDLSTFEKLETKKKACEFFIFNEKVSDLQINCDLLVERKNLQMSNLQTLSTALNKIKERMSEKLIYQSRVKKHLESLRVKIQRCDQEISELNQHTHKEEASLKIFNEKAKNRNELKEESEAELKQLNIEKSKLTMEVHKINQKLRDLETEINSIQKQFNDILSRSDYIQLKKSGEKGFKSENERKEYIQKEITKYTLIKDEINSKIMDINSSIKLDEEKNKNLNDELESIDKETNFNSIELKKINDSLIDFKKKRIECINDIKKVDLNINEINEEIEGSKETIKGIEKMIPNNDILKAVIDIKNQNFPGCYGILMDLLKTEKKFNNAMDIIAKDKLYSLIVDSVDTANKIMEYNLSKNGPVISIIPLEWNTELKNINYPSTSEAVPFLNCIEIKPEILKILSEEKIIPIINKIFGKSMLVKNYEVGLKLAKQHNMNCVTPENEIIYSGAFMSKIGYYDFKRQRVNLYDQLNENMQGLNLSNENKLRLEDERRNISNRETKILRESQMLLVKKNELSYKLQELSKRQQTCSEEIVNIKELITSKKNIIDQLLSDKNSTEVKLSNYNQVMLNKNSSLTEFEIRQINEINKEKESLEKKLIELEKAKNYILQQKINIESKLNDYVMKRELELKNRLNEFNNNPSIYSQTFDFTEEKAIITGIENNLKDMENLEKAKKKFKEEILKFEKESENLNSEINLIKSEINKINEKINKDEAELKAIILSVTETNERKSGFLKNIASLGQIKPEEIEKIAKLKDKQMKLIQNESGIDIREGEKKLNKILEPIYNKLENINRKMKKYDKINRFALDDYKLFKEKREEVNEKMEDLQSKEDEILDVIRVLDEKKENAIQNTFQKVCKSFEYFFKELVPSGYANLTLDNINPNSVGSYQTQSRLSQHSQLTKNYSKAIFINVSFSGFQGSIQSMHQLSGGQKTAVAVALIFALSKIDPPPFYILDEIDAALDPSMRTNLAKLISNLSEQNQYIISTFKPEILEVSNNIYQVKFSNKTSNLDKISKEEARKFIKEINL